MGPGFEEANPPATAGGTYNAFASLSKGAGCPENMDPNRANSAPEAAEEAADQANEARMREKVKDLVPRYLADIRKDVVLFSALLEAGDFDRIRGIGHVLKGTGSTFGFPELTYWGAAIEESALRSDLPKLRQQTAAVVAFLARLD
jgi:HPt (histidine-containing phosphotransfer) domain-containing protein